MKLNLKANYRPIYQFLENTKIEQHVKRHHGETKTNPGCEAFYKLTEFDT